METVVHIAPLIRDLAVILGVAAVVTFIFRRIRQPVVLGYIIAGVIVGPYTPEIFSVTDIPNIRVWAELGVIFLMFALGLEFSFRKLAKVGPSAGVTAVIQIILMIFLGYGFGQMLDWTSMDSIFLGCMISISSTTIIIKAFEELGLKTKRFVQLVFGILIVEDLAAILILVALSSLASRASLAPLDLLVAAGKLGFVVGIWFLVGMFVVPQVVKLVKKHGDSEMLTVVSVGLCLALVTVSAMFHYSVALGAFIMGSILAETTEAKNIEHLIRPLRDIFGAVFFVSVGMLMDPRILIEHALPILGVTSIIVIGKLLSITIGALATGQTLGNSVRTGFSMAQIGEFSFIIATLGLSYKVISPSLYPVIVAASLITTFTTPYLIKISPRLADILERRLPKHLRENLNAYASTIQRRQSNVSSRKMFLSSGLRWLANSGVVVTIFLLVDHFAYPWLKSQIDNRTLVRGLGWSCAFFASCPFLWGMFRAFSTYSHARGGDAKFAEFTGAAVVYGSRVATALLVGVLSLEFFKFWFALVLTTVAVALLSLVFKRQIDSFSGWFEHKFRAGFQAQAEEERYAATLSRFAPWDAHLVSVGLHPDSPYSGKRLIDLGLRETHDLNVVVIQRGSKTIVAPKGSEVLLPSDQLLFLGTDDHLEEIRMQLESPREILDSHALEDYQLKQILLKEGSTLSGISIRDSGIREHFNSMVVGIEREGRRTYNPKSDHILSQGDLLWVVGTINDIQKLSEVSGGVSQ